MNACGHMFFKHVLNRTAIQIFVLAANLVLLSIANRVLGVNGRGAVAAATSWATLFFTVGYASLRHWAH